MPLGEVKKYYREDARVNRNPDTQCLADALKNLDWLYVFGDNVQRVGMGGQAYEMRHEPNAVGVATKYSPNRYYGDSPAEILAQNRIIDNDMKPLFRHLVNGGVVIWPRDGIGTGLSALPEHAPETFTHLENKYRALVRVSRLFTLRRFDEVDAEAKPHL